MAISSIHIETSKPSALIHNERVFSPDYLISNDKNINEYKSYTNKHISELEKLAKQDYQKYSKNNRKLPSNATLIKEAIINLNENHNLNDLEKVKQTLEKEYGYKITNISIHRDEGYIYTSTKNYIMGRNQFINLDETPHIAELDKDNKFYEWNFQNGKWIKGDEIKDYKIEYNYHAHIVMLNYDFSKHRTIRNSLKDLSKMQTLVAKDLGMERGKCSSTVEAKRIGVEVQESRKRVKIREHRVQKRKEKELEKELENEKKKNIKLEKELYNFRDTQREITALAQLSVEDRKALHQLNSMCKHNKITPDELRERINSLIDSHNIQSKKIDEKEELIIKSNKELEELKNQNKSLEEQNNTLKNTLEEKEEELDHYGYREKLTELKEVKKELKSSYKIIEDLNIKVQNLQKEIDLMYQNSNSNALQVKEDQKQHNHQEINLNRF
jgi:hypothetical protein